MKKSILFDDIEWGNKTLPGVSHEEIMTTDWVQKGNNLAVYGQGTYTLRSPGNDLLDFYDEQMQLLDPTGKAYSKIPPSVVYHYRFEHNYPAELFDKSKNYGRLAYLRDNLKQYHDSNDRTYWGQVYNTRMKWLVDKPHEEWTFRLQADLNKFAKELFGQNITHKLSTQTVTGNLNTEKHVSMFWRGKCAGYSVIWEPKL